MTAASGTEVGGELSTPARAWTWFASQLGGHPVPSVVALIGSGNGCLLDALEQHAPETRVLALEPSLDAARTFLARRDWGPWRESGRLTYLVDPDYAGAGDAWRVLPSDGGAIKVLVHPDVRPGDGVARASRVLKKILFDAQANADARRRLAPRYLINALRNIPAILGGQDIGALRGAYKGVPAVIAGAGPSLDSTMDALRATRNGAVLMACDTALRPLLARGLVPDFVVGVDPSPLNARHFLSLPECKDTRLICDVALDRRATTVFEGRSYWLRVADHHPWPWLRELGLSIEQVDVWGSVLTAAFQVAHLAGCDPIVMIGADLSFTGGRSYARGTTYELDWGAAAGAGATLEDVWRGQMGADVVQVEDVSGLPTLVTPAMLSFRDWLVARAQHCGRRVVNATGAGMLFGDGIEQATLTQVLSGLPQVDARLTGSRRITGSPSALAASIRKVRRRLAEDVPAAPIAQWAEFSGGRLDAGAVGAALDEAAHAIETKRGRPVESSVTAWSRLASSTAAPGLLTGMPEAMRRMRLALGGVDEPLPHAIAPAQMAADRPLMLLDALDLLRDICATVLRAEDLPASPDPAVVGRLPVGVLYPWPDTTRFAIIAFESLLGRAWGDVAHPSGSNWFDQAARPVVRESPVAPAPRQPVADRPTSRVACVQLAIEWLRCTVGMSRTCADELSGALDRLTAIEAHLRSATAAAEGQASLLLTCSVGGRHSDLEIPLPLGAAALARVLTGVVRDEANAPYQLGAVNHGGLSVSVAMAFRTGAGKGRAPFHLSGAASIVPTVLAEAGSRQGVVAYATGDAAVLVVPNTPSSLAVRRDGRVQTHLEWPRPINGELPLGEEGAVAWGIGIGGWPAVRSGYVMYRSRRGGKVSIEELPVRPSVGVWWKGRLFWACYPRVVDAWVGVVSWIPGEPVRFECPGLTVFDMQPDGDSLVMQPCSFNVRGQVERRRVSTGWRWTPGAALEPVTLGRLGAISHRATNGHWAAVLYPESDLIQLDAADGRMRQLTCHYPGRAAWVGGSLLVSTVSREVLLFENLSRALESET